MKNPRLRRGGPIDTSDAERFKATVDKLAQLLGGLCSGSLIHIDLFPACASNGSRNIDILADAFKPPKI